MFRYDPSALAAGKLHIFTAIHAEEKAIRPVLPAGVELTVIGIGAVRIPESLDARALLMAGFGGALDPSLKVGDIVWDTPAGAIYTSTKIAATPAEKAALFRQTGALVVDMENATVRAVASNSGVPFYGLRAISDTADEALDPIVLKLVDDTGRVRPAAMAKALLQNPAIIPSLNRLRINSAIAGRALANAVKIFLDENPELYR